MTFNTRFNLGDVADFAHNGQYARIRVDEIRCTKLRSWGDKVLIEYREHTEAKKDGSWKVSKWWPEIWAQKEGRKK